MIQGKVVVVTGGASGMGLAIVRQLAAANSVVSLDRNAAKIEALKVAVPGVRCIQTDITSSDARRSALASIEQVLGRIDILINNAGIGGAFDFLGSDEAVLEKQLRTQLAVNYEAPVMLIKQAIPLLRKSSAPTVVIVTTGLVYAPMSITGSYCASKAAAHVMATVLHHVLAAEGIRVVESLPPSVDTELNFASGEGKKMSAEDYAKNFLSQLEHGHDVINVGQSAILEKLSRLSPRMAFWMLNRGTLHDHTDAEDGAKPSE
jgi:uncharacterized oxidoreductase